MKRTTLLTLSLVLLTLAAGAHGADPKSELRVAIPWTPENLDPTMNLSSIRAAVGVSMFDSLVGRDVEGRIVPELAESWKLLDDTTWQIRLRRNVVFHNGEPFKRYLGKQFQDAYLLGLGGPMQDGDELFNLVSSKGRGLYYKNERIDQLFDLGRGTMDPAKRRTIYSELAKGMIEDATWVFLMQQVDIYATRERLAWTPRADQWMLFHQAALK